MPASATRANPNTISVLRLAAPNVGMHVNHGMFWPIAGGQSLGSAFFWESWFKVLERTGYLLTSGYGGAHDLNYGHTSGVASGSLYDGSSPVIYQAGTYQPAIGEWVHGAIGWDGATVYLYANGVPESQFAWAGPRQSVGRSAAGGYFYVGGPDHSNNGYDVAFIRGWDRGYSPISSPLNAFRPQRLPGHVEVNGALAGLPDFACDYTQPHGGFLLDTSPRGVSTTADATDRQFHHGHIYNNHQSGPYVYNDGYHMRPYPALPQMVVDASCPWRRACGTHPLPAESIPSPASVPPGAKAYDSFGRRNQTFAFQDVPSLGSTEGGSLGVLPWSVGIPSTQTATQTAPFGILGGKAVYLELPPGSAWVETGSATQDIRATREAPANGTDGHCGVSFRQTDASNYWAAFAWNFLLTKRIYLGYVSGGTWTQVDMQNQPNTTWTKLRVTASGTTIRVYVDDGGSGWTQIGSDTTSSQFQTATKAGMASHQVYANVSGLSRWLDWGAY